MPTPPVIKPIPEIVKRLIWADKSQEKTIENSKDTLISQLSSAIPEKNIEENSNKKIESHHQSFNTQSICNKKAFEEYSEVFKHMFHPNNLYNNSEIELDNSQEMHGNIAEFISKPDSTKARKSFDDDFNVFDSYKDNKNSFNCSKAFNNCQFNQNGYLNENKSKKEVSFKNQAKQNASTQKIKAIKSLKPANNLTKNQKNMNPGRSESDKAHNIESNLASIQHIHNNRERGNKTNKRSSSSMSNDKYDFSLPPKSYIYNELEIKNNISQYKIDFGNRQRNCVTPSNLEENIKERFSMNDINSLNLRKVNKYDNFMPFNSLFASNSVPEKSQTINIVKYINNLPTDKKMQEEIIDTLNAFRNKPVKPPLEFIQKWRKARSIETSASY